MALDFDAIEATDTTIAAKVVEGRRMEIPEKVLQWIRDSYKAPKQVPLVASDVYEFCRMLIKGAERIDLGIRVRIVDAKGNEFVPSKDVYEQLEGRKNKMHVKFEAQDRTKRPRKNKTVAVEETPAE